jgi:uncharacterized protein YcfJ
MSATHPFRLSMRLAGLCLVATLTGCAGMSHADRGALVGTTIGGLGGAIIGHQSGNTGAGAVIGGGLGMVTGALVGDAEDAREERDWAMQELQQAEYQQSTNALTNADLIYMSQNGLGDQVIINAVRERGGRFDLDPTSLVQLKQCGVSDAVIAAIQSSGSSPGGIERVKYVRRSPRVVVVEPVPTVGFSFGSSPCYHHHWGHHGHGYHSCYW